MLVPTHVELTALCGAYDVTALVLRAQRVHYEIKYKEVDPETTQCILLSYHDGEHYNAVLWEDDERLRTLAEVRECFSSTGEDKWDEKKKKQKSKNKRKKAGKKSREKDDEEQKQGGEAQLVRV
ncbi:hypothetical protein Pmar_PMAR019132 [Perkinsus marinus ATCC 50983]|uniref:OTU domain-containing protein n=1 Tax=Perkinsus marinus (strain ATCC 50983 / TXsc) TaxID=423536 RepID=C5KTY6_PERM5|nr:hypothetical protein Pmar_PMAR019132 [Perkinsus marinus ATCC 50983]EER12028.1 hypothetical protein Pmar_PMAR019132 [Perkinsus marinus ATCC 50983]|eukprot:XP_002780233.1 hypothetical protein Pmar_PMAR019132 [Perkinsus marinus ATCC 50983]